MALLHQKNKKESEPKQDSEELALLKELKNLQVEMRDLIKENSSLESENNTLKYKVIQFEKEIEKLKTLKSE